MQEGSGMSVTLRRVDPEKGMYRYYRMCVQPDLFGNQCLIREWGRIGRSGQIRSTPYPTGEEAQDALRRQCEIKERRGYATA
jgi:predicted DNA-binding WGR domain protein